MNAPVQSPIGLKRGAAAIVGAAESDLGEVAEGTSVIDLMAQGVHRALDDCGLTLAEVDGVFAASGQSRMPSTALCEYLRLQPRVHDSTMMGGSSFMTHVAHAQAAIEAGLCEVAVIAYGSTQRSAGRRNVAPREFNPYETPFKPLTPASAYALAASRHMHQYGTTREQLAEIAVAARRWALLNPAAWEKAPLTVADVLASRMVSHPLTVRDCCLVTDGGGAIVMTSAARAKSLAKPPAYVLGVGECLSHQAISSMPDLTVTGAALSGAQAYAMAGLAPRDIDVVQVYDAFTITTLLFLEDLGFCPKGEGGRFVADGAIAPGGRLPVNTSGGGLSYCHPGMFGLFVLIEAVRQLRGECGARQVHGAETAIAHGNGGVLSSQSTVVLGTAAAV
ncbi:MAG: thiolase [Rubrivivax sp.]